MFVWFDFVTNPQKLTANQVSRILYRYTMNHYEETFIDGYFYRTVTFDQPLVRGSMIWLHHIKIFRRQSKEDRWELLTEIKEKHSY